MHEDALLDGKFAVSVLFNEIKSDKTGKFLENLLIAARIAGF